jgi:hypothetical protein
MLHPQLQYLTLERLLACPNLVGGQIEVQEYDKIYGGPIKTINLRGPDVYFELEWGAYYDMATDKWEAADRPVTVILKEQDLEIAGRKDGLRYIITSRGREFIVATIDVKGVPGLDPSEVIGLDLNNLPKPEVVQLG